LTDFPYGFQSLQTQNFRFVSKIHLDLAIAKYKDDHEICHTSDKREWSKNGKKSDKKGITRRTPPPFFVAAPIFLSILTRNYLKSPFNVFSRLPHARNSSREKQKDAKKRQKDGLAGNRTLDHSHAESLENDTDAKGVLYH
jgi:hypothetical protein